MNFLKLLARGGILILLIIFNLDGANSCRVSSESLKIYTREIVEQLLDSHQLRSIYWTNEPLDVRSLAKATDIKISLAETHFNLGQSEDDAQNEIENKLNESNSTTDPLLRDIFVTCSVNRDRSYTLSINLELSNPFDTIDVHFEIPEAEVKGNTSARNGLFRIHLTQSLFLVHLSQRIKYDECLTVDYIQLAPNVSYDIECVHCNEEQQTYLDRTFSKRMAQLDSELDSLLSEKLLLGLQMLVNQQRLELDLDI